MIWVLLYMARLAQSVERKALNLVVVGSSPTVGAFEMLLPSLGMLLECFHGCFVFNAILVESTSSSG